MIRFDKAKDAWKSYLILLISVLLSPVLIFTLVVSIIYRSIIYLILKYQNGANFKGILEGREAIWFTKNKTNNDVQFVHFIQTDNIDKVINELKTRFSTIIKNPKFEKLVYSRNKTYYGYTFWKSNEQVVPDDFIKCLEYPDKSALEMDELKQLVAECRNKEFPRNNTLSFELIIVRKPMIQSDNIKTNNQYALIYRFHHALADGDSATRFFIEFYKADKNQNEKNNPSTTTNLIKFKKWIRTQLLIKVVPIFYVFQLIIKHLIVDRRDKNILYGPKLSGIKITRWKTEKDLLGVIKKIKRSVPSVTFSMILYTALSQSLSQYFSKKSKRIPDTMELLFPSNINKLIPIELLAAGHRDESAFKNEHVGEILKLPILCDGKNMNVLERLYKIRDAVTQMEYWYFLCVNWMPVIIKYFPEPLTRITMDTVATVEIGLSNYVDYPSGYAVDNNPVTNSIFLVPNYGELGFCFTCMCYKNSILNFGLTVDTTLIPNQDEIDEILDNIIRSLKNLDREIKQKNII